MAELPETRYVEHDGVHLAYQHVGGPRAVGDGETPTRRVLYLTDLRTPIDLAWDDPLLAGALRRLGTVTELALCELRGWGASDAIDTERLPAMQAWVDDTIAVLDALEWPEATLLAPSELGLVALLAAATHPSRVTSLVLLNPFARFTRSETYPHGLPPALLDGYVATYRRKTGRGSLVDLLAPSRASDPRFRRWFVRGERLGAGPGTAAAIYRWFASTDVTGVLPAVRAPTLLVRRRDDRHIRDGHARYLADHLGDAELVEVEGHDHLWYSGDVDAIVDVVQRFVSGETAAVDGRRVLATVMFSDIVDSTRRVRELGDERWSAELARHDDLVQGHVAAFGGEVIKSTGDGALATFDGPARAIQCATGLRDALAAIGLPVRVGLHTGEVERTASDVAGLAVHVAARVSAAAEAGEVLVSEAIPPLVVGSRLGFEDRGAHDLRGVGRPWRLFVVTAD